MVGRPARQPQPAGKPWLRRYPPDDRTPDYPPVGQPLKHPHRRARVVRPPRREEAPDRGYPRDPTRDPQLVWKGKDEQDAHDLQVPAVPIYIGKTIDPLALIVLGEVRRGIESGRRPDAGSRSQPRRLRYADFADPDGNTWLLQEA